jgi:hypothetical protein
MSTKPCLTLRASGLLRRELPMQMLRPEEVADLCNVTLDRVHELPIPFFQIRRMKRWALEEVEKYAKFNRHIKHEPKTLDDLRAAAKPLDNAPAIYFLFHGDDLVYVGQSNCPAQRIANHLLDKVKVFDRYALLPCDKLDLLRLEAYYIDHFKPKYNKAGVIQPAPEE